MKRVALWIASLSMLGVAATAHAQTVTSSIATSRSSCVAPCYVRFDATNTTAGGTTKPFHDVVYHWDFGDPNSGTWSSGAASMGTAAWPRNVDTGPLAAHVFDPDRYGDPYNANCGLGANTCRQYTVTLDAVYGAARDSRTVVISVTNPETQWASTTTCVNPTGDSGFTGCPASAARVNSSDACSAINSQIGAGKRRILLKGGASYTCGSQVSVSAAGPGLIGSYGSGRASATKSDSGALFTFTSADWRLANLVLAGNGSGSGFSWVASLNSAGHQLVYRVDASHAYQVTVGVGNGVNSSMNNAAIVESDLHDCATNGGCYSYIGPGTDIAVIGGSVKNFATHHWRFFEKSRFLMAHHSMLPGAASTWDYVLLNGSNGEKSRYFVLNDLYLKPGNSTYGISWSCGGEGGVAETVDEQDGLLENSFFDATVTSGSRVFSVICINRGTVRNNVMVSAGNPLVRIEGGSGDTGPRQNLWVYNNSIYVVGTSNWATGYCPIGLCPPPDSFNTVDARNNVFWSDKTNPVPDFVSCGPASNCVTGKNWDRKGGSLTATPFAQAVPVAPTDFKLKSCSGASCPIDAGDAVSGVYLDFWRGLRGSSISLGAHEPGAQSMDSSSTSNQAPPPPPVLLPPS